MYLSRIQIDPANRNTMRALAEPKLFHGAIERCFPGDRQRRLWRIDPLQGRQYLLLVSQEAPDLTLMWNQFGFPHRPPEWETRDYTTLLQRIQPGSYWHFRLTANPTKHLPGDASQGRRGKVVPHVTAGHQQQWLMDKAERHGFSLAQGEFLAVRQQQYHFCKPADHHRQVELLSVTFEGYLTVTDADRFRQTLTEGIGRARAYGMGMMTVVRAVKQP